MRRHGRRDAVEQYSGDVRRLASVGRQRLPGIGHVVISAQKYPPSTLTAETSVVALQVFITQTNTLGLPVGSNIVVGRAVASVLKVKAGA